MTKVDLARPLTFQGPSRKRIRVKLNEKEQRINTVYIVIYGPLEYEILEHGDCCSNNYNNCIVLQ